MIRAIVPALVAAAGYALLELAFFVPRNHLLPWSGQHVPLALLFFVVHGAVALFAAAAGWLLARVALPSLTGTLPAFASVGILVALQAVSFYRERVYSRPRDLVGTAVSLGIVLGIAGLALLVAHRFRRRDRLGGTIATILALLIVGAGVGRVFTAKPIGMAEAVPLRPEADRLNAAETGQRVLLFGFDGATWEVLDPMLAQGRLPNLAALAARGRTFDLETFRPTFSPVVWTSVSTGKNRFDHGIHDVVQTTLPGGVVLPRSMERAVFYTKTVGAPLRALAKRRGFPLAPYRSDQVRVISVFEAASEAGIPTTQIGWYVSWPARPLSGVTISDRFHLQVHEREGIAGVVSPQALASPLRGHVVTKEDVTLDRVREFVDAEDLSPEAWERWADRHEGFVEEMRFNLARDLSTRNVAVDLLARDSDWRLFGVYFRAVDLTHHLTWPLRDATGDPAQNEDLRLRPVIGRYHEFMDHVVGDVLANVSEDAVVVMLSDHGFEDRFAHARAPDGFAILAGGAISTSTRSRRRSPPSSACPSRKTWRRRRGSICCGRRFSRLTRFEPFPRGSGRVAGPLRETRSTTRRFVPRRSSASGRWATSGRRTASPQRRSAPAFDRRSVPSHRFDSLTLPVPPSPLRRCSSLRGPIRSGWRRRRAASRRD